MSLFSEIHKQFVVIIISEEIKTNVNFYLFNYLQLSKEKFRWISTDSFGCQKDTILFIEEKLRNDKQNVSV